METKPAVKRPLVIAHRGFSGKYPENTLAAIRAAIRLGVDYVEIDVQETRDGHVVVFHDYRLRRLCRVSGRVRDITLQKLQQLNPAVPTLGEVLRACRARMHLLIEIKGADPRKVAALIKTARMEREVIVFSLSLARMKTFAAVAPTIPRFGLIARNPQSAIRNLYPPQAGGSAVTVQGLGLSRRLVTSRSVVDQIHRNGWKLFVWTVNRESEMRRLAAWGVDGIITNHPDRALALQKL